MLDQLVATSTRGRAIARGPEADAAPQALGPGLRAARALFDTPAGPALSAGIVAAGTVFIAMNNPHVPGALGACPLLSTFGFYCPGCGGTRAVYDLSHGDVVGAMSMNPLFTLSVPLLAILWLRWLAFSRGRPTKSWNVPEWVYPVFAIVTLLFFVLRNVPLFAPYLAP